jgi:exodeoxyribonuclease VII large subunit
VLTAFARRAPQVRLVVYPSPVQGADAPPALAAALALANARAEVDTLLLVRGGGSLEDLWAFNDERVVRAVAASRIPVICGVGHETDVTLADLAADLRAPTPTAAAELAAPVRAELASALAQREAALGRVLGRALEREGQRLDTLALRLGRPARALSAQAEWLQAVVLRLQGRLDTAAERLSALDPARVLQRGYAWVEGADGRPVLSVRQLAPGARVQAVWADGRALAEVQSVEPLPPAA